MPPPLSFFWGVSSCKALLVGRPLSPVMRFNGFGQWFVRCKLLAVRQGYRERVTVDPKSGDPTSGRLVNSQCSLWIVRFGLFGLNLFALGFCSDWTPKRHAASIRAILLNPVTCLFDLFLTLFTLHKSLSFLMLSNSMGIIKHLSPALTRPV